MGPWDFLIIGIIALIICGIILYICLRKKRGKVCVGCPYSDSCPSKNCKCPGYINRTTDK